jgi:hypothetical protein
MKAIFRLAALALALASAWPASAADPRREYVFRGDASTEASRAPAERRSASARAAVDAGDRATASLALPALVPESAVASAEVARLPYEIVAAAPLCSTSRSPSSERGPPRRR